MVEGKIRTLINTNAQIPVRICLATMAATHSTSLDDIVGKINIEIRKTQNCFIQIIISLEVCYGGSTDSFHLDEVFPEMVVGFLWFLLRMEKGKAFR